MDADSWTARLSSASKRYQSALLSRSGLAQHSGMFMGFEELEGDDDIREEFPCPFCSEYLDIVGLCCHIDEEHPIEARNGVCPVCEMRVGVDMVAHISLQHGNIFKVQRKRKSRKGGSHSTLSLLRKELQDGNLQSLFGGSSCLFTSSNAAPDPLLSSFILPLADDYGSVQPHLLAESSSVKSNSQDKAVERSIPSSPLSVQDKEEKTKRCTFVQGLLMSTILDDNL
ncbi:protein DEHYDRATION-INDUCED 19 homolog 3 isoform X2 [Cucumis melo]|uniref:Protein DEHYDRATION-INDUCED 19 homolog 3 isoform X2 n=1 Tax=Cucumis melo TaxID=3656 RepID=A0A1S3BPJ9_CUCME|nr:protein DEHYDRATION-INDUCED 19 homolog 3 isoform X2 [Cucumis melo]XP_050937189.1 protein DEHYDRATION-INDUCED 19 homolog 3 isoform X2 [Cucumis melo]